MNKMRVLAAAAVFLLVTACGGAPAGAPPLSGARMGGHFSLIDQNGRRVSDADFAGKYRLVYFGYTFCPDACPTDLSKIGRGLKLFEKTDPARAAKLVPIFITVDPARDTPPVLKAYVAAFHPRLIGLTGTGPEIAAVAKRYGIGYQKQAGANADAYLMDHSRLAVLYGPHGAPIALVPQDQSPKAIAEVLDQWVI